jgi:hypothetical protein
MSGIHPNPTVSSSYFSPFSIILQLHCNCLKNSITELDAFLCDKQISIDAIQETFLSSASIPPNFPSYALVRKNRPHSRGGGLSFLVHHSVAFMPVDMTFLQDGVTECLAIKATVNKSDLSIMLTSPGLLLPSGLLFQPKLNLY